MTDIERAARCAKAYRAFGFNVLPSRTDRKGPSLPSYSEYWDSECPESVYRENATKNIQIMCGVRWRLAIVDLDGAVAVGAFKEMCEGKTNPDTWIVENGSKDGQHLYYTIPAGVESVKSRIVWGLWELPANKWRRRSRVEILGDKKLVMAPPSVHPDHGGRYHFLPRLSPKEISRPAEMPQWMLDLPEVETPTKPTLVPPVKSAVSMKVGFRGPSVKSSVRPAGRFLSTNEALDAIPDKIALAASWGLRMTSQSANRNGWVRCYRVNSDESNPSAAISVETGTYWEDGSQLRFFQLLAMLKGLHSEDGWKSVKEEVQRSLGL